MMDLKQFEKILENEGRAFGDKPGRKVAELKELVRRVTAGELLSSLDTAGEAALYDAVWGTNDGNPFTNEAIHVFCTLALQFYEHADAPVTVGN
jgi:hypothetical protein